MTQMVLFVHGAWMTPLCWEKFMPFFEAKDYKCIALPWPYHDRAVEDLRSTPDPALARLSFRAIVERYAAEIRGMDTPPIVIGHSFGGLVVQMLLSMGLGKAGIAIDAAPPKGVFQFYPTVVRSNLHVLLTPGFWSKVLDMSLGEFQYGFANAMSEAEQKAAYERYVVPETGHIFFEAATSMVNDVMTVQFDNPTRPPLLMISGGADHIVPTAMNRANVQKYKSGKVDFQVFDGRGHTIILEPGWEEVATFCAGWLAQQA